MRILGGAYYESTEWDLTAGSLSHSVPEWADKEIKAIFQELGLSESASKQLYYNIRLQHSDSSGEFKEYGSLSKSQRETFRKAYNEANGTHLTAEEFKKVWDEKYKAFTGNGEYTKADFAHQSITTATNLTGTIKTIKDLSGWRGDVTYEADANPSMGNDDYKADLDAVNIAQRMKDTGKSYLEVANKYYQEADEVREKEFLKNEGGYNKVADRVFLSLVPSYKDPTQKPPMSRETALAYLKSHKELEPSYNFLMSLKEGKNQFE